MEIQSHYGSSRGPVRESLRLLLQNGLVEHQQRRGFRVRAYSPEDIRNIYNLRRTLEGMVVSDLAGRDLTDLVQVLDGRLQIMEVCFKKKDIDGYFLENSEFHQAIIDFTENKPIAQVLHYVNEISLPVRYRLMGTSFPTPPLPQLPLRDPGPSRERQHRGREGSHRGAHHGEPRPRHGLRARAGARSGGVEAGSGQSRPPPPPPARPGLRNNFLFFVDIIVV